MHREPAHLVTNFDCRIDRRGAVAVMFAMAIIPLLALVGLAVDYGIWNQDNSAMQLAADTAALNAARIAGNAEVSGETQSQYINDGTIAAQKWFAAVANSNGAAITPTINVQGTTSITATVSYAGAVPSIFGNILYRKLNYPISGQSTATVSTAPYLDVEIMLDDSSSMQVGATVTDIENMDYWSACSVYEAVYNTTSTGANGVVYPGVYDPFSYVNYTTSFGGMSYNASYPGAVPFPIPINSPTTGKSLDSAYGISNFPASTAGQNGGPPCAGFTNLPAPLPGWTTTVRAGEPCAFACHDDITKPAGTGPDLYGLARSTIGTSHPVQLRFDVVKLATNAILTAMKTDDLAIRNLNVGVFAFNDLLTQVYPQLLSVCSDGAPTGEACDDWATAIAAVGLPPTTASAQDSGIKAELLIGNAAHADTDFTGTMTALRALLTPSGTGATAASPRKVLFLITDGLAEPGGTISAVDYSQCTAFKQMGYTVYVAYMPYAPYPDVYYLINAKSVVEGTGAGSETYNLQQCATNPGTGFVQASNLTDLNNALQGFLKLALNAPARFTN